MHVDAILKIKLLYGQQGQQWCALLYSIVVNIYIHSVYFDIIRLDSIG